MNNRAARAEARIAALESALERLQNATKSSQSPGSPVREKTSQVRGMKVERKEMKDDELETELLKKLHNTEAEELLTSHPLANGLNVDHERLVPILYSLQASQYINLKTIKLDKWKLTEAGKKVLSEGSPESRLYATLPPDGSVDKESIQKQLGMDKKEFNSALGQLRKRNCLEIINKTRLSRGAEKFEDTCKESLLKLKSGTLSDKEAGLYKKRKFCVRHSVNIYEVSKAAKFSLTRTKKTAVVTTESWAEGGKNLKPFNVKSLGRGPNPGALHPLMKVRQEYRDILIGMGFEEMDTNNFVESVFWNFDSLFQPQQHPARDAHDTFYIRDRATKKLPPAYLKKVKKVHEEGGFGSIGYRTPWSEKEAHKLCLRTHTTAISAQVLYQLGKKPFKPKRYFSIDRVFRNETLDKSHLAEFHQIEGFVADYDLNLSHLLGMCQEFFSKVGISNVRFKPAYNPYTEPSMEIFGYSEPLKKWMEVGNSGIFRPEMLRPMGLPENVKVIAWGFGLERQMMLMFNVDNIRDLMGPRVKVNTVRNAPIVRI